MNDLIADVKLAIELEKKGYDFYAKTAAQTNNPLAVATLTSLAERELIHEKRIVEFYQNLTGERRLASDWLKGVAVAPNKEALLKLILVKLQQNLNRKFETPAEIDAAYKIAEGLERDSYNLYHKIAQENNDPTAKKFFAALAQEEQEHYTILEETLQYLNHPADWFKKEERWIIEG